MTTPQLTRITEHLSRLRLHKLRERFEALLQEASEQELSYADFLDRLLSEEAASKREKQVSMHTTMARFPYIKREFPVILELLAQGAVNLTTVGLLAPHLTAENHAVLLDEARHKSKRQVEELVARLRPQPPVPSTVRRLPAPGVSRRSLSQSGRTGGGARVHRKAQTLIQQSALARELKSGTLLHCE